MSDISKIDKNFAVKSVETDQDTVFFNCLEEPFKVYGLILPENQDDVFRRMPLSAAEAVSDGVAILSHHTAGGRLKFRTNSPYVIIRSNQPEIGRMAHFTLCGSGGFDMYKKIDGSDRYIGTFVPPVGFTNGYESKLFTGLDQEADITVHFPLYSRVKSLEIGLKAGCTLKPAAGYKYDVPVVYYGSSITQGGCASRPGMAYQNIISREQDCDHINLGFSGSAKGEDAVAEYIAGLKMSLFVYDYDHNAPSVEHLRRTHSRMFNIIRRKNPKLPIIAVSRPGAVLKPEEEERREIIKATCDAAKAQGDDNVYFIDGNAMMQFPGGNEGTVDNCHPTDLGFRAMANVIGAKAREILKSLEK